MMLFVIALSHAPSRFHWAVPTAVATDSVPTSKRFFSSIAESLLIRYLAKYAAIPNTDLRRNYLHGFTCMRMRPRDSIQPMCDRSLRTRRNFRIRHGKKRLSHDAHVRKFPGMHISFEPHEYFWLYQYS